MGIHRYGHYAGHYGVVGHSLRSHKLPLHRSVGHVHHGDKVLVGQCAAYDVGSVDIYVKARTAEGLDLLVEALGNGEKTVYPARFQVPESLVNVIVPDGASELGVVQFLPQHPRIGAPVGVHHAYGHVLGQALAEEGVEKQRHHDHYAYAAQQIHRPAKDEARFAACHLPH